MPEELLDEGNALGMLRSEHEQIRALLANALQSDQVEFTRLALIPLLRELRVHAAMEREVFYPYAKGEMTDKEVVSKNVSETIALDELTRKLESIDPADPGFTGMMEELIRRFNHHIYELEQYIFLNLEGGDYSRHNGLVRCALEMKKMRENMLTEMTRPRPIGDGSTSATLGDVQLRAAQQKGRSLDPSRDVVPTPSNESEDVTVTTEGDIVSMGDKHLDLDAGDGGHASR